MGTVLEFGLLFTIWCVCFTSLTFYAFNALFGPDLCGCNRISQMENVIKPRILKETSAKENDLSFVASLFEKKIDRSMINIFLKFNC